MERYEKAINELLEILIHRYGEHPLVLREILEDILQEDIDKFYELRMD